VESLIQIRGVVRVTVAICHDARVYTGAVAVPDFKEGFRHWFARVDVDNLDVEGQGNALLVISDVFADKLALNPVWALSHFWAEHAAVVARENHTWVRIDSDASQVAVMVGGEHAVEVAGAKVWLLCRSVSTLQAADGAEHTRADNPLRSRLFNLSCAALMHRDVIATLLQSVCAVVERSLVGIQICSAFSNLLSMFLCALARVGNSLVRKESSSNDVGELHDGR
jgi:hypothetical protein